MNETPSPKSPYPPHKVRELLLDLFERYSDALERGQWAWEQDRWQELVYCLLSSIEGPTWPNNKATVAARVLSDLALLDLATLAGDRRTPEQDGALADVRMVLVRTGFSTAEADLAANALSHLAQVMKSEHQGKVQVLLRNLGSDLVTRTCTQLSLDSVLGSERASSVVVHWLQNVFNLPILVDSPGVRAFCTKTGVGPEGLLAAADELDINAGLVDDALNRWVGVRPGKRFEDEPPEVAQGTEV